MQREKDVPLLQGVTSFQLQLPPVSIGRGVKAFFELSVEIGLAGKSRHIGNVLQADIAVLHQLCRILKALLVQIVIEVVPGLLMENGAQVGRMHIQPGSQCLQGHILVGKIVYLIHNHSNILLGSALGQLPGIQQFTDGAEEGADTGQNALRICIVTAVSGEQGGQLFRGKEAFRLTDSPVYHSQMEGKPPFRSQGLQNFPNIRQVGFLLRLLEILFDNLLSVQRKQQVTAVQEGEG